MPLIEASAISKTFYIPSENRNTVREHFFGIFRPRTFSELAVLRRVSLELADGEALAIMGRNGSGKSTLLKLLAGIYQPDEGRITVNVPITPILGLGLGWSGELTARDNIYLTGTAMGLSLRELDRRIDEILDFAELQRFGDVQLKFFSSGMSSRLAYAIAFTAASGVLLLDEIFAVGDASFQDRCKAHFQQLRTTGHPVILVTHDPLTAANFCDRAILLEEGRILHQGPAEEVASHYSDLLHGKPRLVVGDQG